MFSLGSINVDGDQQILLNIESLGHAALVFVNKKPVGKFNFLHQTPPKFM